MLEVKLFDYYITISTTVVEILKNTFKISPIHMKLVEFYWVKLMATGYIYYIHQYLLFLTNLPVIPLPDQEIAQIIVDYEFENSGRKTIYLGEWHTHPEKVP